MSGISRIYMRQCLPSYSQQAAIVSVFNFSEFTKIGGTSPISKASQQIFTNSQNAFYLFLFGSFFILFCIQKISPLIFEKGTLKSAVFPKNANFVFYAIFSFNYNKKTENRQFFHYKKRGANAPPNIFLILDQTGSGTSPRRSAQSLLLTVSRFRKHRRTIPQGVNIPTLSHCFQKV